MFMLRLTMVGALVAGSIWAASVVPGDARRGEQLFQSEQCIQCHSFQGKGGTSAPDLSKRIDRNYTPAVMASLMWNHAPEMWGAMKNKGIAKSQMTPEIAADLFAYFVSARYFEQPGDAGRGKQDFTALHCAACHGISTPVAGGGPPVAKWESLADPLVLAQQMWNHGPQMREAFKQKKLPWARLTGQQLTDMLVYLQNLPETKELARHFEFPPSDAGEKLFQSKGCVSCHLAPQNLLKNQTLTDIAADMWDHQPEMKQPAPTMSPEEMRQIIGYLWVRQYFTGNGYAERGKKVFTAKNCATCHNDPSSGAPKLSKGNDGYSDITMVAALWEHGPRMLDLMGQKKIAWPRFTAQEMTDLIAYLNQ
jgi:mono/diheme cytochrome c family protein